MSNITAQATISHPIEKIAAKQPGRFAIDGVYLDPKPKGTLAVATDGHRLAIVPTTDANVDAPSIVPRELFKGRKKSKPVDVTCNGNWSSKATERHAKVDTVPKNFPPYVDVLPSRSEKEVTYYVGLNAAYLRELADAIGGDEKVVLSIPSDAFEEQGNARVCRKPIVVSPITPDRTDGVAVLMSCTPNPAQALNHYRSLATVAGAKMKPDTSSNRAKAASTARQPEANQPTPKSAPIATQSKAAPSPDAPSRVDQLADRFAAGQRSADRKKLDADLGDTNRHGCAVRLPTFHYKNVERAARVAGVSLQRLGEHDGSRGWWIVGNPIGSCQRRTAGAKAFVNILKRAGFEAAVADAPA